MTATELLREARNKLHSVRLDTTMGPRWDDIRILVQRIDAFLSQPEPQGPPVVYGPERQDYPGGPIYRLGTSTGAALPPQPEPQAKSAEEVREACYEAAWNAMRHGTTDHSVLKAIRALDLSRKEK